MPASLYSRIGGYDALARVVDSFLVSMSTDPVVGRFATGMNVERQRRNRQLTLDFLVEATGGPTWYLGQDMSTAHAGLGIRPTDWELAASHFRAAAEKWGIHEPELSELLGVFNDQRTVIVDL